MEVEKILQIGVQKEIITNAQRNELMNLLNVTDEDTNSTSIVVKILYYIGGLIMLGAMISLMSHTIQHSTYAAILGLGTLYAGLFFGIGETLWRKNEKLPAGILYFLFISTFSFIVLDIEKMIGFFPHFSDIYILSDDYTFCALPIFVLSAFTIFVNTKLQEYRAVSLLALPTIFCSYAIYITIIYCIFGDHIWDTTPLTISNLIFFIGLAVTSFIKDRICKADYSKWMYFIAAVGIFQTMNILFIDYLSVDNMSLAQTECFILSCIYVIVGALIQRKPFTIIGILGAIESIIYLEFHLIKEENTFLQTSVVLITGLLILYLGVLYNKNAERVTKFLESLLSEKSRKYLPQNR